MLRMYQKSIDVNARIKEKQRIGSMLHTAVLKGGYDAVKKIVEIHGKDSAIINSAYKEEHWFRPDHIGGTALNIAAARGETAIVKALLQAPSIDVNARDPDFYHATPLLAAAMCQCADTVIAIAARASVKVNEVSDAGMTALMYAAYGHSAAVPALLKLKDIEVNFKDPKGRTALHYACLKLDASEQLPSSVNDLLNVKGIEVNVQDSKGYTALMFAARCGNQQVITRLLCAGADPALATPKGRSAAKLARNHGYHEAAEMLEKFTASCAQPKAKESSEKCSVKDAGLFAAPPTSALIVRVKELPVSPYGRRYHD